MSKVLNQHEPMQQYVLLSANVSSAVSCSYLNQGLMGFTLHNFRKIEDGVDQQPHS
jgi:hypothetical protein